MYYFIYDAVAQSAEHSKEFARIENRLLDFGIKDKVVKISPLKSVRDAVAEAYKNKFNTIITIGGDELFLNTLSFVIGYQIAVGMIPLGKHTTIATMLNIPSGSEACETLSARRVREITLGKIDNRFFLSSCKLSGVESMTVDSSYTINVPPRSEIEIINQRRPIDQYQRIPQRKGMLTVVIKTKENGSLFQNKQTESYCIGKIISVKLGKTFTVTIDSFSSSDSCSLISTIPNAVKCIVGKHSLLW